MWTEAPLAGAFPFQILFNIAAQEAPRVDWHGRGVRGAQVEVFKTTAGKPNSIKANQWPIQPYTGPCWGMRGRGAGGSPGGCLLQLPFWSSDLPRTPE